MQVVHTDAAPPNHGRIAFASNSCTWNSRKALRKMVTAYGRMKRPASSCRGVNTSVFFPGRSMVYFTRIPGCAPESGARIHSSLPPGPAASTMPSDRPNFILRSSRFATTTVSRPSSCFGS